VAVLFLSPLDNIWKRSCLRRT